MNVKQELQFEDGEISITFYEDDNVVQIEIGVEALILNIDEFNKFCKFINYAKFN
jgi:hypothetical protein